MNVLDTESRAVPQDVCAHLLSAGWQQDEAQAITTLEGYRRPTRRPAQCLQAGRTQEQERTLGEVSIAGTLCPMCPHT